MLRSLAVQAVDAAVRSGIGLRPARRRIRDRVE